MPKQDLCDDGARCALSAIPDLLQRIDCPFEIDFQALSDRLADVPDEANGLLKLLDGQRTLREALAAAEDAGQAAAAARDLSALGVIRPVPAARAGAEPPASQGGAAGGSTPRRAGALPPAAAGGNGKGASTPLRIVRFPARRKRLPPPPGRLGRGASGGLAASGSADGGFRSDGALSSGDGAHGGEPALAPVGGAEATPDWRRRVAAILIAGALAAVTASALVLMHRKGAGVEPPAPGGDGAGRSLADAPRPPPEGATAPDERPAPAREVPDAIPGGAASP